MKSFEDRLNKALAEMQYKSPTSSHSRKQMGLGRAAITPEASQTLGGHKPQKPSKKKKKKAKKIDEGYCYDMRGKLSGNLICHDNSTTIPKGSEIRIVDPAHSLPDIEYDGSIYSVDEAALFKVFKPEDSFHNRLCKALCGMKDGSPLDRRFTIVEPDILATIS